MYFDLDSRVHCICRRKFTCWWNRWATGHRAKPCSLLSRTAEWNLCQQWWMGEKVLEGFQGSHQEARPLITTDYIALKVRTPCCRWYRWRILCCQLGFPSTLYDLQSMQGQSNYCLTPVVVWQQYTWKTRAGKASCPADVVASTCLSCWRFILNSGILQGIQVPICLSRCSYLGEASNWIQACEVKSVIQTYCVGFKWQKSLDIF